eukprot:746302-Hanusia_phi.AAC.1
MQQHMQASRGWLLVASLLISSLNGGSSDVPPAQFHPPSACWIRTVSLGSDRGRRMRVCNVPVPQAQERCRNVVLRMCEKELVAANSTAIPCVPLQPTAMGAPRADKKKAESLMTLEELLAKVRGYCSAPDDAMISKAFYFAQRMHEGQLRRSGEPYFIHPVGVASIIADMKLDSASIVTGLLHDTVEDTSASLELIEQEFGSEVAQLVDGVTKIGKIQFTSKEEQQAENFRKMIVAMARDIRVILVKLADRTHNVRTLKFVPAQKQKEVARETLDLYAPLAHRLGIFWMKIELEDTSLRYLEPEVYEELKTMVAAKKEERQVGRCWSSRDVTVGCRRTPTR